MKWEQYYSHTYNDQGHIKHVLKTSPLPVIDQEGLNQITSTNTTLDENPPTIDQESLNQNAAETEENEHTQNKALHTSKQQKRRVHWNDKLTIHALESCGAICQRPDWKKPDITICVCGSVSTPTTWEWNAKNTASRATRKLRHGEEDFKSKKYRDQLTDVVTTLYITTFINNENQNCPPPKNKEWNVDQCICSICCDEVHDDRHSPHIVGPTKINSQKVLRNDISIPQRPKAREVTVQLKSPNNPQTQS
jgi:hypothetical protein